MPDPSPDLTQDLMRLAQSLPALSDGRLRLARNEADATADREGEAATFLKIDGGRFGRDIEVYGFLGRVQGWEATLADFAMEVVLPLRNEIPEAYEASAAKMRELGGRLYGPDRIDDWNAIFDDGGGSSPAL